MNKEDLLEALKAAVTDECGPFENLQVDTTALEVPGWDSLAHVRIMMNFEARIGREIDIDATYRAATVGELLDLVNKD